jgi:SulP family sulfate permease
MPPLPWLKCFPFLRWGRPSGTTLRAEGWSAITVTMVLVPQAVAYAALAGMPLITGLYAALLPPLAAVLWGGTSRLSVGPSALTCLLITASLSGLAEPASPQWVAMAVWLALLSGLLQLFLGLGGLGWLLNLVSSPVLTGFTQAAGVLILASQLPGVLGLQGPLDSLWNGPQFNLHALAYGLGSVAALWLGKAWLPRVPAVMLVVVGSGVLSYFTDYALTGAAVVGDLPAGLPTLSLPALLPWSQFGALMVPALVIGLVSFLETASTAKLHHQADRTRWDDNQDLVGQGLAKIMSALSGSFATSTSFSRSAIGLYSGARTGWSGVITTGLVLLTLLFLMPALHHVPRAVLAAVVVVAVSGLLKPVQFVQLWRISKVECMTSLVSFSATVLSAPRIYWGVLIGVVLGLLDFLYQRLHPRIIEVGLHPDGSLRDRHLWKLEPLAADMYALRMDAELDFAAASSFERTIADYLAANPNTRHVCLFAHPINRIDATGVAVFMSLQSMLQGKNIALHVSGVKLPVEQVLRRAGALKESSLLHLYRTDNEALMHLTHP